VHLMLQQHQGDDLAPAREPLVSIARLRASCPKTAHATKTNDSEDWLRGPATIWIWSSPGRQPELKELRFPSVLLQPLGHLSLGGIHILAEALDCVQLDCEVVADSLHCILLQSGAYARQLAAGSKAANVTAGLYLSGVESISTARPPRLWIGRLLCLRCSSFVNAAICARDISIGTFSTYHVMPSVQGGVVSEPA